MLWHLNITLKESVDMENEHLNMVLLHKMNSLIEGKRKDKVQIKRVHTQKAHVTTEPLNLLLFHIILPT